MAQNSSLAPLLAAMLAGQGSGRTTRTTLMHQINNRRLQYSWEVKEFGTEEWEPFPWKLQTHCEKWSSMSGRTFVYEMVENGRSVKFAINFSQKIRINMNTNEIAEIRRVPASGYDDTKEDNENVTRISIDDLQGRWYIQGDSRIIEEVMINGTDAPLRAKHMQYDSQLKGMIIVKEMNIDFILEENELDIVMKEVIGQGRSRPKYILPRRQRNWDGEIFQWFKYYERTPALRFGRQNGMGQEQRVQQQAKNRRKRVAVFNEEAQGSGGGAAFESTESVWESLGDILKFEELLKPPRVVQLWNGAVGIVDTDRTPTPFSATISETEEEEEEEESTGVICVNLPYGKIFCNASLVEDKVPTVDELVEEQGFDTKEVFQDGNCFYLSVVETARLDEPVESLRASLASLLEEDHQKGTLPEAFQALLKEEENIEEYIGRVKQMNEWVDEPLILYTSQLLEAPIMIWHVELAELQLLEVYNEEATNPALNIWYCNGPNPTYEACLGHSRNHYRPLFMKDHDFQFTYTFKSQLIVNGEILSGYGFTHKSVQNEATKEEYLVVEEVAEPGQANVYGLKPGMRISAVGLQKDRICVSNIAHWKQLINDQPSNLTLTFELPGKFKPRYYRILQLDDLRGFWRNSSGNMVQIQIEEDEDEDGSSSESCSSSAEVIMRTTDNTMDFIVESETYFELVSLGLQLQKECKEQNITWQNPETGEVDIWSRDDDFALLTIHDITGFWQNARGLIQKIESPAVVTTFVPGRPQPVQRKIQEDEDAFILEFKKLTYSIPKFQVVSDGILTIRNEDEEEFEWTQPTESVINEVVPIQYRQQLVTLHDLQGFWMSSSNEEIHVVQDSAESADLDNPRRERLFVQILDNGTHFTLNLSSFKCQKAGVELNPSEIAWVDRTRIKPVTITWRRKNVERRIDRERLEHMDLMSMFAPAPSDKVYLTFTLLQGRWKDTANNRLVIIQNNIAKFIGAPTVPSSVRMIGMLLGKIPAQVANNKFYEIQDKGTCFEICGKGMTLEKQKNDGRGTDTLYWIPESGGVTVWQREDIQADHHEISNLPLHLQIECATQLSKREQEAKEEEKREGEPTCLRDTDDTTKADIYAIFEAEEIPFTQRVEQFELEVKLDEENIAEIIQYFREYLDIREPLCLSCFRSSLIWIQDFDNIPIEHFSEREQYQLMEWGYKCFHCNEYKQQDQVPVMICTNCGFRCCPSCQEERALTHTQSEDIVALSPPPLKRQNTIEELIEQFATCPKGHVLQSYITARPGLQGHYKTDVYCANRKCPQHPGIVKGEKFWSCLLCDHDLCEVCYGKAQTAGLK